MIKNYNILPFFLAAFLVGLEPFADKKVNKEYFMYEKDDAISIDGLMVENVWKMLDPIDGFTQDYPYNGEPPSLKTEIRMFYSNEGIYIYARMYDDMPDQIQKRLSRRDDLENGFFDSSDWVMFQFDSRHDHQTGYLFAVNCSGVKADGAIFGDEDIDINHNSLWYAETNIDHLGWTAELFLPFSSFRFDSEGSDAWGFNSKRYIYRFDETDEWVVFPPEVNGRSSKFGHITGLKSIKGTREIYFTPYYGIERSLEKNQFLVLDEYGYPNNGSNFIDSQPTFIGSQSSGFDVKYNFKSNAVLSLSFKPDFGQVEVDPADINISYYETYLEEKRPFFIEDASMFNLPIQMFYSRRIGEIKDVAYNIEVPTYIDKSIKLSGRNPNGFSYGLIAANTNNQISANFNVESEIKDNIYGIARFKQDLFGSNSFIGFLATQFDGIRGSYDKVGNQYEARSIQKSNSYSIDGMFNYFDNRFNMDFQFAQTGVDRKGYAHSIESSYDINRFWSVALDLEGIDENFNNSDVGYIKRNDIDKRNIMISYQNLDLSPKSNLQEWSSSLNLSKAYKNSQKMCLVNRTSLHFNAVTKSQHVLDFKFSIFGESYNDLLLYDYKERELGVPIFSPSGFEAKIQWESDPRFENTFSMGFSKSENDIKDNKYEIAYQHDYEPQFDIKYSFKYNYEKQYEKYHWIDIVEVNTIPHYIFANADKERHNFIWRFDAFLSKSLTIQNYTEFIQTNNKFGNNWMELTDQSVYPEHFNTIAGIEIYPLDGNNPSALQNTNPNNDTGFYSKYSELIYNLVVQWEINPRSNLYFVYTRYWFVNGKKFDGFVDFLNYSENEEPWVEKSFDNGISIKYTHQFNL